MLEIKGLRTEFIRYLEEHSDDSQPAATAKNALFAYYHDIGMPFEAIFINESSMRRAQKLLADHFEKVHRKDPEGHASVHYNCWVKFREFLETTGRLGLLLAQPETDETQ